MKKPSDQVQAAKPESNRTAIVQAALACFVENGFHQTGIRDIARRAGVSLGNLYNHFPGKDALIAEIARIEAQEIDRILHDLPEPASTLDGVRDLAAALLIQAASPENAVLTADLTSEAMHNPVVANVFSENEARLVAVMRRWIDEGVAQGDMDPPCPPETCVRMIMDCARAMGARAAFQDRAALVNAKPALDGMIRRMLARTQP